MERVSQVKRNKQVKVKITREKCKRECSSYVNKITQKHLTQQNNKTTSQPANRKNCKKPMHRETSKSNQKKKKNITCTIITETGARTYDRQEYISSREQPSDRSTKNLHWNINTNTNTTSTSNSTRIKHIIESKHTIFPSKPRIFGFRLTLFLNMSFNSHCV